MDSTDPQTQQPQRQPPPPTSSQTQQQSHQPIQQQQPPPPPHQPIQQQMHQTHPQQSHHQAQQQQHPHAQPPLPPPQAQAGYPMQFAYPQAGQYRASYPAPYAPYPPTPNIYPAQYPSYGWQQQSPANFSPASALATPPGRQLSGPSPNPDKTSRKRTPTPATLKDPKTGNVVSLKPASEKPTTIQGSTTTKESATRVEATNNTTNNNTTNNSKGVTNSLSSSSSSTSTSTPPSSSSSTSNNNTNTSATPSLSISNILLQKVSEEGVSDVSETNGGEKKVNNINTKTDGSKAKITAPKPLESTTKPTEPVASETKTSSNNTSSEQSTNSSPLSKTNNNSNSNNTKLESTTSSSPIETKSPSKDESTEDNKVDENDSNDVKTDHAAENGDNNASDDKAEETKKEVELPYEPGQYNPSTQRHGRKVYTKEFMLAVAEKMGGYKILGDQEDDEAARNSAPYSFGDGADPFAPAFSNSRFPAKSQMDASRRPNQANYMGRNSTGQEKQRKIIPSSSLTQEVELKTVSNPWRPVKEVKDALPPEVMDSEVLKRKFRSILNKLTPNNFENLSAAVTELNIDTEAKLGDVIDIVFEKALSEPKYCVLYGQMCSHLKQTSAGTANFGNTLLKRCQNQFQADVYAGLNVEEREKAIEEEQDPDVKKHKQDELYEDMRLCRMKSLGLIIFIGELYKIQMLNNMIMFECINRLLSDTSNESLECLCDLLTTIGEKLDRSSQNTVKSEKKPQKAPKPNAYSAGQKSAAAVVAASQPSAEPQMITTLDPVFEHLHKIRKNDNLPLELRIRFKLLDLCELREKHNWYSKDTKDNNPKKIEEIREAHEEKLEAERRQNAMGPRRSQEGRRGLGHSGGSSNRISSLANESSGNRGPSNMHASASSHSIRDHSLSDNMKSNHNDIESQKNHQKDTKKLLENFVPTLSSTSKPATEIKFGRPSGGLYNKVSYLGPASGGPGSLRPTTGPGAINAAKAAEAAASASAAATGSGKA